MFKILTATALLAAAPVTVQAFEGPFFDGAEYPIPYTNATNPSCLFSPYNDPGRPEADVRFNTAGTPIAAAGGNAYQGTAVNTVDFREITAADIEAVCPITNVDVLSQNGADATYATDTFIGITFTGIPSGDTQTYEYTIGISSNGSTTSIINARSIYTPPDTTPPTALSLVRTSPTDAVTNADSLTWTITFDEVVENVDPTDFVITGTSASLAVTGSGATYGLTLSGGNLASLSGSVAIGLAGSPSIQDVAGNPLLGGISGTNESTYSLDNGQDGVLISGPGGPVNGEFAVTLAFQQNGPAPAPSAGQTDMNAVLTLLNITNGTRTGAAGFAGSTISFNVTPTGPGTVTISVPGGAAQDGVGNPTLASNIYSVTAQDTTPPVISVPANITQSTDAGLATASVTFAPTATDNVDGALMVTTNPVSGFDFPVGTTTVTASAIDTAGNSSSATFTVTVTDDEAPVVTTPANITDTAVAGQTSQVVNFTVSALDNVDGAIAATANPPSGTAFPVGTTTVAVTATDGAMNTGSASFTVTINDGSAPVVTVPANIAVDNDAGQGNAVVTFAVSALDETDGAITPVVTTAPTAGLTSGSAFPVGTTTVTATARDVAGNVGTAQFTVTVSDTEGPAITVPMNITQPTDAGLATAAVTFMPTAIDNVDGSVVVTTNPVSGFAFPVGTTTVTASAIDIAGNSNTATFTVTVNDEEAPVVTVPADITQTAASGQSTQVVTFTVSATDNVDGAVTATANPPSGTAFPMGTTTVTVTATDAATNEGTNSFTVTVTDGEAPVVTVPADITVPTDPGVATAVVNYAAPTATDNVAVTSGPTLTAGLGSGATFPLGTTTVTYQAMDGDNNTGSATFTVTVVDEEAPVIRPISAVSFEADPSGTRRIDFSTFVDDNVDTRITPVFRLDGNIIASPYDFPVGLNVITINATDTAGNPATEVIFNLTITAGVAPDVPLITTADINANRSMTIGGTAEVDSTVRVTFPDATFQEVTATGGVFSVTSAADMPGGTVSVTATDVRGYTSDPATVDLFPDYVGPTVTITGAPTLVEELVPFTVTITFSEDVTDFDQGDITLTGGTITAFAGAGAVYTADITPIIGQDIAISVAADVAEDAFTNPNAASNVVTIRNATMTATEELVSAVAKQRNMSLIQTRPRISRFLLGGQLGSFNANVTQGVGNFDFTTSSDRPVWFAGQGQWSTQGDMETSYANLTVGAHFEPTPNVLLGVMAMFDNSVSDEGVARLESTGWMVGPYAVARMADQPLVFSGSYLMGQSDNSASPLGTYTDDYSSDRVLATLGVAGEVELDRLMLIPLLDFAYASDENEAYVDGDSNPVRSMKVTSTQATIGLDFIMPIMIDNGTFDLIGGIGATSSVDNNGFTDTESTRGQTELGFRYGMENGGRLTARATYDGLGQDDYEAYGAEVIYEISF